MPESVTFCGRTFQAGELELMRQIAREFSGLGVTEIARTVCELLEWKRSSGGLKNHECRHLLERLQTEGFLQLPELRQRGGRGPRRADVSASCAEPVLWIPKTPSRLKIQVLAPFVRSSSFPR